jgi:hypothetical protein
VYAESSVRNLNIRAKFCMWCVTRAGNSCCQLSQRLCFLNAEKEKHFLEEPAIGFFLIMTILSRFINNYTIWLFASVHDFQLHINPTLCLSDITSLFCTVTMFLIVNLKKYFGICKCRISVRKVWWQHTESGATVAFMTSRARHCYKIFKLDLKCIFWL